MADDTITIGFQCAAQEISYENRDFHQVVVEQETMMLDFQCAALET